MDIKAIIDSIISVFQQAGLGAQNAENAEAEPVRQAAADVTPVGPTMMERFGSALPDQQTLIMLILIVTIVALVWRSSVGQRAREGAEEAIFSNWRLALLGSTGLVLSLASGWTTWDGMRNFTGEPILSLMITFGIQGVMLIVAWLIGESFATGMNQGARAASDGGLSRQAQTIVGSILGILFAVSTLVLALSWSGVFSAPDVSIANPTTWASSDRLLIVAMGLIIVAAVLLTQQDIVSPYLRGSTVVMRNMVLWIMFLACMATSVFFSFDSLFSVIFPKDERKRAADIRSINQVSGVVADIGTLIQQRRIEQADKMFVSDGWKRFEGQLNNAASLGRKAPDEVRAQIEKELGKRAERIAELEEKKASARSGQAGLATRKIRLTEELGRLEGERPEAAQVAAQQKSVVTEIEKQLDEQRARVLAEERGVEGSGKAGRGKFWRAAKEEENKIKGALEVARKRLDGHAKRLDGISSRIAIIKGELAQIDGRIAQFKGASQSADQMIEVTKSDKAGDLNLTTNPIALVAQMARERDAFRIDPNEATLSAIQQKCQLLVTTSAKVESLRNEAAGIDCDPKQASAAAGAVFALNVGLKAFTANCAGGDSMPQTGGTDALLQFGRKCLQDSGLPSKDTAAMGAKLSAIDLSRDDKAHRFVVTWNAFSDGNRLAFLALAIAIAIDSLVFMSGLFGANALRSPLSDVPTNKARSASQLEAIIDTALMPHKFDTARLVLGAMQPMTQTDGFMARIFVQDSDPHAGDIRRVLNAGTTIGAVRHVDTHEHVYEIRAELFEYLSHAAKREFEANSEHADLAELERTVMISLLPDVQGNVETVLHYMHPIEDNPTVLEKLGISGPHGFVSEINLEEVVDQADKRTVRGVLNAGATANRVQRPSATHYYIHKDLYKSLARIRARSFMGGGAVAQLPSGAKFGGSLSASGGKIAAGIPAQKQIAAQKSSVAPANQNDETSSSAAANDRQIQDFSEQLIAAIGIDPQAFFNLDADAFGAALGAGSAIQQLRHENKEFGYGIAIYDDKAMAAIEKAHDAIRAKLPSDNAMAVSNLETAQDQVTKYLHVLALMPGGPYEEALTKLVRELEVQSGEDELNPEEDRLLRLAKNIRSPLFQNSRKSKADWEKLHLALEGSGAEREDGAAGDPLGTTKFLNS